MADQSQFFSSEGRVKGVLEIPLHQFLGLRLSDPSDFSAGLLLDVTSHSLNQADLLHGGIVSALLDVASYIALVPLLAAGEHAVTHDISVQLLRPVLPEARVLFRGHVLRAGRRVAFLRAEARVEDRVVAAAQVTKTRFVVDGEAGDDRISSSLSPPAGQA